MSTPDIEHWTLPHALLRRAEATPDLPYLSMLGGPALSFGEMELRSRRIANGLRGLGVAAGDRVLVMLPNCVEYAEAWFAISRLAAVTVTVNPTYRGSFLVHLVGNSAAQTMIVAESFLPVLAASIGEMPALRTLIVLRGASAPEQEARGALRSLNLLEFEALRSAPETGSDLRVAPHDICAIVYTSGTTGKSKGVLMPHAHMVSYPHIYLDQLDIGSRDVFYCCLPMFHTNALALSVLGGVMAGVRVHMAPQFSGSRWIDDIRSTGATITFVIGSMLEFLVRLPPNEHDADNALRVVSAAPIPPVTGAAFEQRYRVPLVTLYGSTEAGTPIYHPRGVPLRAGSCGKALGELYECRIADPATDVELPPGEVGELLIRPRIPGAFMAGYNAMPEATVQAWRNLWYHSGDAMRQDEEGYFFFVDRTKDCIRRRGENISSFEVEQVVLEHEHVAEVAAVGIRSPFDETDQEVKVCVVLKPGVQLEAAELHAFCRERMPAFIVPRYIEFLPGLPKTPTLRVQKHTLRDLGITEGTWAAPDADSRRVAAGRVAGKA